MFAAEIVRLGLEEEPRPNALWYLTGTDGVSIPTDLVNAPTDGPVIGRLIQGPPDYPFGSYSDPQWDSYTNEVTIPAGHSWVCLQMESAVDPQGRELAPCQWHSAGHRPPDEDRGGASTDTDTTTQPHAHEHASSDADQHRHAQAADPRAVPEASTLSLLGSSAVALAGYAALQMRARRRK